MEIVLNKTELAGALPALGKLVSRTATVEANRAVEIRGFANLLHFRTRNIFEEIEFTMFAEMEEDFPTTLVNFEQFRLAVRNCKNKMLKFEYDCGEIYFDGVMMAPVKGHFSLKEKIPEQDATVTELPADTLSALSLLAPLTDREMNVSNGTNVRSRAISGINISGDGFTATNGRELSNIPLKLETTGSITIPFPLTLLATKAFGESGKITTWQRGEETRFELVLGNWSWRATLIKGNYPNWKRVVPERTTATHYVSFQDDRAERLTRYLKSIPDDKEHNNAVKLSRLPEVPDNLHLESSNRMLFSILAEFDPNWNDLCFCVRKEFLLHLLEAGHRKIELNDAFGPLVGTGGNGEYIAMPIITKRPQAQTEQKPEETASSQTDTNVAVQAEQTAPQPIPEQTESVTEQIPNHEQETSTTNKTNTTPSTKENTTMIDTNTITHVVSAPAQTSAQNNKPESKLNPMDELIISIEAFKAKLKAMVDESTAMSRKVCEVAISQRQKEREYARTKKTIEKIRVASGF